MADREAGPVFHWEEGINALEVTAAGPHALFSTSHAGTTVSVRLERHTLFALAEALEKRLRATQADTVVAHELGKVLGGGPHHHMARRIVDALEAAGYPLLSALSEDEPRST